MADALDRALTAGLADRARHLLAAENLTPKPQEGTWTLTAPDGRTWEADAPLRCVAAEQRERVPAAVRLQRILDAASEDHDWQPMKTAPRDGTNILLAWGQDGVSQGHYVPGLPHPWKFIDTNDGITWLINHAVDNEYGPTHWQPLPRAPGVTPSRYTTVCTKDADGS